MLCDQCGEREATNHEVVIKGGQTLERHLCDQCASQAGMGASTQSVPVTELVSQYVFSKQGGKPAGAEEPACTGCGMGYGEFKRTGLVGCSACYESFADRLNPLLERAHEGAATHVGKVPRRALAELREGGEESAEAILGTLEQRAERIETIRRRLDEAVKAEQYERAAALRDELDKLTSGHAGETANDDGAPAEGPGDGSA